MYRTSFKIATLVVLLLFTACSLEAKSKKKPKPPKPKFDYYLLTLSYAPDFCAQPKVPKDPRECGAGRRVGFVVHGLWPQGENSRGPQNCGGSPVAQGIVRAMLSYLPTESLIQHEWKTHGTCSGLTAAQYFDKVKQARDALKIPAELTPSTDQTMPRDEIVKRAADANPDYKPEAFRASCYPDGSLQELRICLTKDDLTSRPCGTSVGQCPAGDVKLRALR